MTDSEIEELKSERDFLLRSIKDLDEEYRCGEVDPGDYERLKDKYTARAAEVLRRLGAESSLSPEHASTAATSDPNTTGDRQSTATEKKIKKKGLLIGGVLCILAGVALALLASNTGTRLPGNVETGSANLAPQQQADRELQQAAILEQDGNDAQALQLFLEVLAKFPDNETALASAGWIEFEAGVAGQDTKSLEQGETYELKAVRSDPAEGIPHAYLGTMYFVEGQTEDAVIQYAQFLATDPTSADMKPFVPDMKKAYLDTKSPMPKALG